MCKNCTFSSVRQQKIRPAAINALSSDQHGMLCLFLHNWWPHMLLEQLLLGSLGCIRVLLHPALKTHHSRQKKKLFHFLFRPDVTKTGRACQTGNIRLCIFFKFSDLSFYLTVSFFLPLWRWYDSLAIKWTCAFIVCCKISYSFTLKLGPLTLPNLLQNLYLWHITCSIKLTQAYRLISQSGSSFDLKILVSISISFCSQGHVRLQHIELHSIYCSEKYCSILIANWHIVVRVT